MVYTRARGCFVYLFFSSQAKCLPQRCGKDKESVWTNFKSVGTTVPGKCLTYSINLFIDLFNGLMTSSDIKARQSTLKVMVTSQALESCTVLA